MPVEKFTVYPVKAEGVVDIEAQCHGKTQGSRLSLEQMHDLDSSGGKKHIVMFQRGQGFDTVR